MWYLAPNKDVWIGRVTADGDYVVTDAIGCCGDSWGLLPPIDGSTSPADIPYSYNNGFQCHDNEVVLLVIVVGRR